MTIVTRDRTDRPAKGAYDVCYVNAYQAQPGEGATWRGANADLVLRDAAGREVIDEDWGEPLLDTSTAAKRARLAAIVGAWIDGCARDGFDAVEPDNLDSWTRSHGMLTANDNLAFAELLAGRAHAAGLAIAQKNA
ncbi:endo alpha-1,4 polygalactosaminidase, partial [Microbacterium sp.]|uniref:endo alpha-1,4 polygalactosaminidase n=1 Tax=Microbacterium sp. TaxID=51671 RepID=UPI0025CDE440